MTTFMTSPWATQVADRINTWPDSDVRATKLDDYWAWIETARQPVHCTLALVVRDLPAAGGTEGDTLLLHLDAGSVTATEITNRTDGESRARYVMAGDYQAWLDLLGGYDVGKTVMYRRLLLEKGDVLEFFMAAYYWVELLTALREVPTGAPLASV